MKSIKQNIDFHTLMRHFSVFKNLSEPALEDLEQSFFYKRYSIGTIINENSYDKYVLYLIRSGKAYRYLTRNHNDSILLQNLELGDTFGKILPGKTVNYTTQIKIIETAQILVLTFENLSKHLSKYPQSYLTLLKIIEERLENSYNTMVCLSLGDVHSRFKFLLKKIANKSGIKQNDNIILPPIYTQHELAQMIGARRETVSRLISQMSEEKVLIKKGRTLILLPPILNDPNL